jgi:hypothetical protein
MYDIYDDFSGDKTRFSDIRRKTLELGSILHIARSYPANALKRTKVIATLYKGGRHEQRSRDTESVDHQVLPQLPSLVC